MRPSGSAWKDDDWRNWRHRVFQANADAIGKAKARPYDLRHSFVSLLIHEGQSILEVARQVMRPDCVFHFPPLAFRKFADARVGIESSS